MFIQILLSVSEYSNFISMMQGYKTMVKEQSAWFSWSILILFII